MQIIVGLSKHSLKHVISVN